LPGRNTEATKYCSASLLKVRKQTTGQITVATVVPIKKGELLLAVCRIVRRIQIDGDSAGTAMQPFSVALDDAIGQGLAQTKQFLAIRGIFKARQSRLRG
jgi:hypothetical protein